MKVVIIGNGVAGITAARHIRKHSNCQITVISSETDFFFSRTALMYVYMGHQTLDHTKPYEDWFWAKNRIDLIRGHVEGIDFEKQTLRLAPDAHWVESRQAVSLQPYDKLILATGSVPRTLTTRSIGGVQGLYSAQDLELLQKNTQNIKNAIVVGGGLIGIELAEMLQSRQIETTILVREPSYWNNVLPIEESKMVSQHILKRGIKLAFSTEVVDILTNEQNCVTGIKTRQDQVISADFVGVSIGVRPNIDFLRNTAIDTNVGILVNSFLETNLPNTYAIGDCAEHRDPPTNRLAIEPIWYTGRHMGETVAKNVIGARQLYNPGVFYNSAKFFDLEYQTYGRVSPKPDANIKTAYWQHPTREVCLRINYNANNHAVVGFNTLGWRLRQAVCERWITQQTHFSEVCKHLQEASFDPEFSEKYKVLFS